MIAIVTIDAIGCQTAIADTIVTQGGDYLLSVKDNQPGLHEAIEEFFAIAEAEDFRLLEPDVSQTLDKGHGRLETRRCTALAAPAYLEELARWKDVRALVKIDARREMGNKVQTETRYAITSPAPMRTRSCVQRGCIGASRTDSIAAWMSSSAKTPRPSGCATPQLILRCCDASR